MAILRRHCSLLAFGWLLGFSHVAMAERAVIPNAVPIKELGQRHTVVAEGLAHPWGLAFLPDGGYLVTERVGRLRRVSKDGQLSVPIAGVPEVLAVGQGGMLDVALDPAFERNRWVYLSYAEADLAQPRASRTAVGRGRLEGERLTGWQVLFRQQPAVRSAHHYGSRLVFDGQGGLWITLGDRGSERDQAQVSSNTIGKVVHLRIDGLPVGKPVHAQPEAPRVWSIGHRNIQGAVRHPKTGELWVVEHGPQGGDELNRVTQSGNYGWPRVTWGREYGSGTVIGEATSLPGFVDPEHIWVPSIAPSGLVIHSGNNHPEWSGDAFVGALRGRAIARLRFEQGRVVAEERWRFFPPQRIRDVREGPDGALYLLTDEAKGAIWRVGD